MGLRQQLPLRSEQGQWRGQCQPTKAQETDSLEFGRCSVTILEFPLKKDPCIIPPKINGVPILCLVLSSGWRDSQGSYAPAFTGLLSGLEQASDRPCPGRWARGGGEEAPEEVCLAEAWRSRGTISGESIPGAGTAREEP